MQSRLHVCAYASREDTVSVGQKRGCLAIMYLTPQQARVSSEESVVEKGRRERLDKIGVGADRTGRDR